MEPDSGGSIASSRKRGHLNLDKREVVQPEEKLSPGIVARFQQRIRDASKT